MLLCDLHANAYLINTLNMKRRAILLGHVDGQLSTNADLDKVCRFLCSSKGGAWEASEIIRSVNLSRKGLDVLLNATRVEGYDFVLFYFSGHGEYVRGTALELNPQGEEINESELSGLGARQINIFDCCRKLPEKMIFKLANSATIDSLAESRDLKREACRKLYDMRNMAAAPQFMSLYACEINEYAHDFGYGGIYTNHLINAANTFNGDFLLASEAHNMAINPTSYEAHVHGVVQTPDYFMAKLPSRSQIVLVVNPT